MSDEKRTINVDGLSDRSIKAFQEGVDASRDGKGIWIMEEGAYNKRMDRSFDCGSVAAFVVTAIGSACMAVYVANEEKIKDGFANVIKFIFGKKK